MFFKEFWQKNYKKILPILTLMLLLLAGHFVFPKTKKIEQQSLINQKEPAPSKTQTSQKEDVQDKTLKEQIGQMLILGFRGTQFQENSFINKAIKELKIGGIILFDTDVPSGIFPRNIISPEQTKKLIADLQKNSTTPLLISIDVEGGFVNRLKPKYGFINIPSAQKMGQGTPGQTLQIAKDLGKQLSDLGINFDFAPVVDLNLNPQNPIIGNIERSFGDDPTAVSAQAESFINGLNEYKIITSLKHFPGHGSSQTDSHFGIADITATFQAKELIPFQLLIKKGLAPTIMVGHLFNRNLDQNYPATLSYNIIQKTLKELLHFQGVVVCDDLSMGAITQNFGPSQAVIKMAEAGCNLIIISNNVNSYDEALPYQASEAIFQAVKSGEIATSSIEESYNKIIKLKKDFAIIK
ncbi:MAG: glycoside hydrolase family 3 N-terminal domain-containing protein [Candidatus Pacebacteria bacterium]|nr:glycoside hydrolase family 3 N-terminal domain-containing protein [Candidatus Paceibacterota bacterium]